MGFGEFLLWIEGADVSERSDAARLIARTTLRHDISLEERCTAEAALSLLLDDSSPLVRGALSEVLSLSALAPRQILHALALDQFEVSAAVLARSALGDETLIEVVKRDVGQAASIIADRANLSAKVAMAIAERCGVEPCLILITNQTAKMNAAIFAKMIERHQDSPNMRGALLADPRLDLTARQKLIDASSHALCTSQFVQRLIGAHRAIELERNTVFDSSLYLVEHAELDALPPYVRSLHQQGRLTNALAMKALVYGRIDFVATIIADLAARSEDHIRSVLVRGGENAIRALLKDIGFSGLMLQLALRALLTWREVASGRISIGRQELAWQLMRDAENAERGQDYNSENDDLAAFMRRIYLEITRANARSHAEDIVGQARQEEAVALVAVAALEHDIAKLMLEDVPTITYAEQRIEVECVDNVPTPVQELPPVTMVLEPALINEEFQEAAVVEVPEIIEPVVVAASVEPDVLEVTEDSVEAPGTEEDEMMIVTQKWLNDEPAGPDQPINGPLFDALQRFDFYNAPQVQTQDAAFFARFAELMGTDKAKLKEQFNSKFADAVFPAEVARKRAFSFRAAA
jgi:uncharacterized protein (DUF2336 family)